MYILLGTYQYIRQVSRCLNPVGSNKQLQRTQQIITSTFLSWKFLLKEKVKILPEVFKISEFQTVSNFHFLTGNVRCPVAISTPVTSMIFLKPGPHHRYLRKWRGITLRTVRIWPILLPQKSFVFLQEKQHSSSSSTDVLFYTSSIILLLKSLLSQNLADCFLFLFSFCFGCCNFSSFV